MTIVVRTENELYLDEFGFWSGASDRWETIKKLGLEDYFDDYASELFYDGCTDTELNDWMWFDSDDVLEEYMTELTANLEFNAWEELSDGYPTGLELASELEKNNIGATNDEVVEYFREKGYIYDSRHETDEDEDEDDESEEE